MRVYTLTITVVPIVVETTTPNPSIQNVVLVVEEVESVVVQLHDDGEGDDLLLRPVPATAAVNSVVVNVVRKLSLRHGIPAVPTTGLPREIQ